jgi:hypothetical protein
MGESRRVIRSGVAVAVVGAAVAAAGAASGVAATAGTPEAPQTVVMRYSFDRAASGPVDESGHAHALTMQSGRGGAVRTVSHGTGHALEFPKKCGGDCPKVVLQTASTDDLNPGQAPFRYGATVLLARNQTTAGQNVLQKGYSAAGGQYKLQIDGAAGRPSCALVGDSKPGPRSFARRPAQAAGRPRIHLARSTVTVADGAWHTIECRRDTTTLTILVDGVPRGSAPIPADLSVSNAAPLSMGGKGAFRDNDQFQGTLDDVWFSRA